MVSERRGSRGFNTLKRQQNIQILCSKYDYDKRVPKNVSWDLWSKAGQFHFFFGGDCRVGSRHKIQHFYYTTCVFTCIPEELPGTYLDI